MNRLLLSAAAATLVVVPGCLVHSSKHQSITGAYVASDDARHIVVGRSTTAQVEERLGTPSSTFTNDDGSETWNWTWTKRRKKSGSVFLIASGHKDETTESSLHVQFENGVAVRKWRD
jgi:outer membrane protein assembly factor BamE (lipoprotein component of BamABCDE complex)